MANSASTRALSRVYLEAGVPETILNKHYTLWTMGQIREILRFYSVSHTVATKTREPKLELMRRLALLVEERGLTETDRLEIALYSQGAGGRAGLREQRRGVPRPPQKPIILRATDPGRNHDTTFSAEVGRSTPSTSSNDQTQQHFTQPSIHTSEAPDNGSAPDVTSLRASDTLCAVCFEDLSPRDFPERRITASCTHEPDVCRSCLSTSISTQLRSRFWNQIGCPTCGERLNFPDVKDFADPDIFER